MQRKVLLILVGIALLLALELGYSVAIHKGTRGGTLAGAQPFKLQGPVSATISMLNPTNP